MLTKILAIETSCDETAFAFVECDLKKPSFKVLSEVVSSQIKIHRPYGGVVPTLAKREHNKNLPVLYWKIFAKPKSQTPNLKKISNLKPQVSNIDLIAVTVGPGLEPALWTGVSFANALAKKLKKPIIGVNHLEGHVFSNWLPNQKEFRNSIRQPADEILNFTTRTITFPAIVLVVSGGHTILLKMTSLKRWFRLGETRDDAVGEAFDKVAKMLGLAYPGGPEVEKLAVKGDSKAINFPRPMVNNKNYEFSFSGLKTSVLYYLKNHSKAISLKLKADTCASFQQAAVDVLTTKTIRAAKEFKAKSILLCGGVACNKALQQELKTKSCQLKAKFFVPDIKFNTDNAVMIAAAACLGKHYPPDKALPNLNL